MPKPHQKPRTPAGILKLDLPDLSALILCGAAFFFWINLLIEKWSYFGYTDWDLALYANAMWSMLNGSMAGSLWGVNFLTNHSEYIAFLVIPVYAVFPSSLTLVAIKLFSVIAGGFILYLIAKDRLGWTCGLVMTALYFLFPANWFMLIFEFHFESLCVVFLFLTYYFLHIRRNFTGFISAAILASICKENIPAVIFMLGFLTLLSQVPDKKRFGVSAMTVGAGIFILNMFVIMPIMRAQADLGSITNPYLGMYWASKEGLTLGQNILDNLARSGKIFFNPINVQYYKDLLAPFALAPFLSPLTFLVNLPLFLQTLLSYTPSMHTIHYHYAATVTPFLFLAAVETLSILRTRSFRTIAMVLLAISLLLSTLTHARSFSDRVADWQDPLDPFRWEMVKEIPEQSSVIASFGFLEKLANRPAVYPLRNVLLNYNPLAWNKPYQIPRTKFALVDWDCPWIWGDLTEQSRPLSQKYLQRLRDFYFNEDWHLVDALGEVTLLSSQNNTPDRLVRVSRRPFQLPKGARSGLSIGEDKAVALEGLEVHDKLRRSSRLPMTLTWQSLSKTEDLLMVVFELQHKGTRIGSWEHPISYMFNATPLWVPGQYVQENYNILLPQLPDGEYHLVMGFWNISQKKIEPIFEKNKRREAVLISKLRIR